MSRADANCFLCAPASDLSVYESPEFVYLAGLGPVVDGYSVLAAKLHLESMADLPLGMRASRDQIVSRIREQLLSRFGSCLLTEHGRTALCAELENEHDAHCLHAHFLLFPGAADISERARSFFLMTELFRNLNDAMSYAAQRPEYFLVSPSPDAYQVFSGPLNMPRQLARLLVCHEFNVMHLADWKDHPNREGAVANASLLRSLLNPDPVCYA